MKVESAGLPVTVDNATLRAVLTTHRNCFALEVYVPVTLTYVYTICHQYGIAAVSGVDCRLDIIESLDIIEIGGFVVINVNSSRRGKRSENR
jgi:hypothetical protein